MKLAKNFKHLKLMERTKDNQHINHNINLVKTRIIKINYPKMSNCHFKTNNYNQLSNNKRFRQSHRTITNKN
jgi:hypothetical protein